MIAKSEFLGKHNSNFSVRLTSSLAHDFNKWLKDGQLVLDFGDDRKFSYLYIPTTTKRILLHVDPIMRVKVFTQIHLVTGTQA